METVKPAGIGGASAEGGAKDALTWQPPRAQTPPHLLERGFQHWTRQPPGKPLRRIGAGGGGGGDTGAVTTPPSAPRPGKPPREESAAACLTSGPASQLARWQEERAEQEVYASRRREPLGAAPPPRGGPLPAGVGTLVACGRPPPRGPRETAKDAIFPRGSGAGGGGGTNDSGSNAATLDAEAAAQRMYARTHGSYAPGEQRTRGYDWSRAGAGGSGIDPARHRFGLSHNNSTTNPCVSGGGGGAAEAASLSSALTQEQPSVRALLQPELEAGTGAAAKQPPAAAALVDLHRRARGAGVGEHRPHAGVGSRALLAPADAAASALDTIAFGATRARGPAEPAVGDLLRWAVAAGSDGCDRERDGNGLAASAAATAAAAAATARGGGANQLIISSSGGGSSTAHHRQQRAATMTGGSGAKAALAPPRCAAEAGVEPERLLAPLSRAELAGVVAKAGVDISPADFDAAFALAAAVGAQGGVSNDSGDGQRQHDDATCSLADFMQARQRLRLMGATKGGGGGGGSGMVAGGGR